jgi:hypothetical protein
LDGLQILYLFDEGSGSLVGDSSGVGTPADLTIADSSAVSWLPDGGLLVNDPTIIRSGASPTDMIDAVMESSEVTLEAWVIPHDLDQSGPARIMTLSSGPFLRNFTIGQEYDFYEARLRTTATSDNGFPQIQGPQGSATTSLTHIVFTRRQNNLAFLYVNNVLVLRAYRGGDLSNWDEQMELALADELTQDRPFLGAFHLVSVYSRALNSAEIRQNFEAGPRPEQGSDCDGFTAGPTNGTTSIERWFLGLLGALTMGGLGFIGFQNVRLRTE